MSRFTDQLYRTWLGQNGYSGPHRSTRGGMGGVPPMSNQQRPITAEKESRGRAAANDDSYSRPDKQGFGYVDNIIKNDPSSFFKSE
ncbi:hypothetical protein [Comamonas composti]|uniref:hypothetical protein n=1 Tax=Comamonas composti TaxID=408558 RepID=UPI0012EC55DA|nr:hypothetical protein [Comamonas composti]